MLKDHWEEYEDTENRGDIWIEGDLLEGANPKLQFHFYHEFGDEKYTVDVYDDTGRRIGQLAE